MKNNKSLACPKCNSSGIKIIAIDSLTEKNNDYVSTLGITRRYNCFCDNCQTWYQVNVGKAKLKQYHLLEDDESKIKLHVSYRSEFDRGYKIVTISNTTMVIMEDDKYPIILDDKDKEEYIMTHSKTRKLIQNTWMNRHR